MHLADAGDDKPAMRQHLGTAHPAGAMARVTSAKMDHADHKEAEKTQRRRHDPGGDHQPGHADIENQEPDEQPCLAGKTEMDGNGAVKRAMRQSDQYHRTERHKIERCHRHDSSHEVHHAALACFA